MYVVGRHGYHWSMDGAAAEVSGSFLKNINYITSDCDASSIGGEDKNFVGEAKYLISSRLKESIMYIATVKCMVSEKKG